MEIIQSDSAMNAFRQSLRQEFMTFLLSQAKRYPVEECLKVDLHCHDRNSDKPDELWGRILGLPETWLKTKKLVKALQSNGCDPVTVTNHNNARSCWELQDKGIDVLVAAEFTCYFPEYSLFVHVLTYGFTPEQEVVLERKRSDIYDFLRYAAEQDIPVILPHPLYFYTRSDRIDPALFEKFAVLFQRFEVLNGQRDQWQSVLTLNWAQDLSAEKIERYARRHRLDPADYGVDPRQPKVLTGGSDCHMGIFAGKCGSWLHVPDLASRRITTPRSELALEAIRAGRIAAFGYVGENEKLNIALLDYFSQVATRIEDPGLLRLLFHRGELSDKVACFTAGNLLLEMQKHKNTQKFFDFIHSALQGKKPNKLLKWKVKKDYRFCIEHLERIADSRNQSDQAFVETVNESIHTLFTGLNRLVIARIEKCALKLLNGGLKNISTEEITRNFEIPMQVSSLVFGSKKKSPGISDFDIEQLLDLLTFPLLVGSILLGTSMGSARLLYQNRSFLNEFAERIGRNQHPRRALYLTDTLKDRNGVSSSLSAKLREIQRADMPIDFLICHADATAESHLHVVEPLASFNLADFGEQELRVPDLMEIGRIFCEGGYDRVICSTEGPMAVAALFLKHMYNVPCYFFMHTDWLDFIRHNTDLNQHERDRVRRLLRFFYGQFSGVFVLNREHRDWLTGHEMQLEPDRVLLTAHHVEPPVEQPRPISRRELFADAGDDTPVLLYAGRLSREKGIGELPEILRRVRASVADARLVVCGTGPHEDELRRELPDALFTGWIDKARLRQIYAAADIKVFPTRFDTFGNVVLEAFSCGLPVAAYDCKGPRDIIEHGVNGYLAGNIEQMSRQIVAHLGNDSHLKAMREQALRRSREYDAEVIMQQFAEDLGLGLPGLRVVKPRSVA
ncbi:MAG: glycosyltransferase [Gammaproteobacteria bacterium]|jgi:glycosyltransferase involved in cell wall biosynthesis